MTRGKAIEILKYLIPIPHRGDSKSTSHLLITNALAMAIKALEQEPCDDVISRAYIEPIVEELENICINGDEYILSLLSNIKNAPPVTPQPKTWRWIMPVQDDGMSDPILSSTMFKLWFRFRPSNVAYGITSI